MTSKLCLAITFVALLIVFTNQGKLPLAFAHSTHQLTIPPSTYPDSYSSRQMIIHHVRLEGFRNLVSQKRTFLKVA